MPPAASEPVTISYTDHAISTVDSNVITFSTRAIGTAAANRLVVVGVTGFNGVALRSVLSLTVAGVSATIVKATPGTNGAAEVWIAAVPTGATGDIVVTWSGGVQRTGIGVWAIYGASATAYDTGNSTADPLTDTINIDNGGVLIACEFSQGSGGTVTTTWTNITENYDESIEGNTSQSGASDAFATAQTGRTITATFSAGTVDQALAMASFRPA